LQPTGEGRSRRSHSRLGGAAGDKDRVRRRSWMITRKAGKTVWC
jgi:hypothetical protein